MTLPRPAVRVFAVGDLIVDRYLTGDACRLSSEAPIPVVRTTRERNSLGGVGSVAVMAQGLGARVAISSVLGKDSEGELARSMLSASFQTDHVVTDPSRCTTLKTRVLGSMDGGKTQQIVRVDREDTHPIDEAVLAQVLPGIREIAGSSDVIAISDYGKGVCSSALLSQVSELASQLRVPIVCDPCVKTDLQSYVGFDCITPNRAAAARAAGLQIETPEQGVVAARKLLEAASARSVVVTLDADGIAWACRDGRAGLFPARFREATDVTGAGDMVLAVLACCIGSGMDYPESIELANTAAALEIQRAGAVPVGRHELVAELGRKGATSAKILSLEELLIELAHLRHAGQRIVFTNGCFDLLHPGHLDALSFARAQGDCLVVGLNSDSSVRSLKGSDRPIIDEVGRARMLAGLACVDYVVRFDDVTVADLVKAVRPDILVKSAEYQLENVIGRDIVESYGGRVVLAPMLPSYSTTSLIRRIQRQS